MLYTGLEHLTRGKLPAADERTIVKELTEHYPFVDGSTEGLFSWIAKLTQRYKKWREEMKRKRKEKAQAEWEKWWQTPVDEYLTNLPVYKTNHKPNKELDEMLTIAELEGRAAALSKVIQFLQTLDPLKEDISGNAFVAKVAKALPKNKYYSIVNDTAHTAKVERKDIKFGNSGYDNDNRIKKLKQDVNAVDHAGNKLSDSINPFIDKVNKKLDELEGQNRQRLYKRGVAYLVLMEWACEAAVDLAVLTRRAFVEANQELK